MDESASWRVVTGRYRNGLLLGSDDVSCSRERHGTTNPNWRETIRRGGDATTSFDAEQNSYYPDRGFFCSASVTIVSNTTGIALGTQGDTFSGAWMRFSSIANPSSLNETEANNQALKYFVERANETQRSMQGIVTLGELGETLRMIRNPAKALRKGLDRYLDTAKSRVDKAVRSKSSKPNRSSKTRKQSIRETLSDTWLENAFGWQPLLSEIDAGAKALAKLNYHVYPPIERIGASGRTGTITEGSGSSFSGGACGWTSRERTTLEVQVRYKGGVKCTSPNASAVKEFGFTPRDFIPSVWELIPWSFVADYFTNIGDILNGFSYNTASFAWRCKTVRKIATKISIDPRAFYVIGDSNDIYNGLFFNPGKPVWIRKVISRRKHVGGLVPDFQFEIPGMGTKWINLAALSSKSQNLSKYIRRL